MYCKVCLMNHIMDTINKWNMLTLILNYNSRSKALEGVDHITKIYQPWNFFFFLQAPLCHQKIHDYHSQNINLKSIYHMLHIQQQGYLTPFLHNVSMHICPTCVIHGCDFITCKGYKLDIMDDNFNGLFHLVFYVRNQNLNH